MDPKFNEALTLGAFHDIVKFAAVGNVTPERGLCIPPIIFSGGYRHNAYSNGFVEGAMDFLSLIVGSSKALADYFLRFISIEYTSSIDLTLVNADDVNATKMYWSKKIKEIHTDFKSNSQKEPGTTHRFVDDEFLRASVELFQSVIGEVPGYKRAKWAEDEYVFGYLHGAIGAAEGISGEITYRSTTLFRLVTVYLIQLDMMKLKIFNEDLVDKELNSPQFWDEMFEEVGVEKELSVFYDFLSDLGEEEE